MKEAVAMARRIVDHELPDLKEIIAAWLKRRAMNGPAESGKP